MIHIRINGERQIKQVIKDFGYKTWGKFVNEAVSFYLGYKFKIKRGDK